MNNFDEKQRKEFKIKDIFITDKKWKLYQVPTWASISTRDLREWETPRITVTWLNNWIIWNFADMDDINYRVYENFISVSFLWTIFYHNYKASLDMKVHCLKPINFDLDNYVWKYLVSVLRKSIANSSYVDQVSSTVLPDMSLYLPVDNEWNPDRVYMGNYIKNIEEKCKTRLQNLIFARGGVELLINTKSWKEFKIWDLFEIKQPKVYHTKHVKENIDWIPYVVRSEFNNWMKYKVEKSQWMETNPSNVISFWAENSSFFYQKWERISWRDIYYIDTSEISYYSCLFLISCFETITGRYSYNFGLFPDLLRKETIKLPVDNEWNPNREYMWKYMKTLMDKNKEKLNCLN